MDQAISTLKERLSKAEAKEARAEKALESAKNDTARLRIALQVIVDLQAESEGESSLPASSAAMAERHSTILALLQIGEDQAQAPAEIYQQYQRVGDDITIDTFRTTIWRMKDTAHNDMFGMWIVKGENGRYWREPASMRAKEAAAGNPFADENPFGSSNTGFPDDLDDDHPF